MTTKRISLNDQNYKPNYSIIQDIKNELCYGTKTVKRLAIALNLSEEVIEKELKNSKLFVMDFAYKWHNICNLCNNLQCLGCIRLSNALYNYHLF